MVSLSSGLLQFVSSANLVTPGSNAASSSVNNGLQQLSALANQLQSSSSSTSTASAQLADDTYTPSSQSTQSSTGQSVQTPLQVPWTTPGISNAEANAMFGTGGNGGTNYNVPLAWSNLKEDIAAGDLSSAQTDLTTYQQALVNTNADMSSLTAPSAQFMSDLTALGSALQQGDVSSAQSAFATAKQDAPQNLGDAYSSALGALELNGEGTVNALVNSYATGSSYTANSGGQLSTDIANFDSVSREAATNRAEELISKGFSASDSWAFADAEFSLGNNYNASTTTAQDASFDSTRTTQWVQALTSFSQNLFSTGAYKTHSVDDGDMMNVIASVLAMSSINAASQTQSLVQSTLGANTTTAAGGGSTTSGSAVSINA